MGVLATAEDEGCGVSPALPLQGARYERRQHSTSHPQPTGSLWGSAEGLTWQLSWGSSLYLV